MVLADPRAGRAAAAARRLPGRRDGRAPGRPVRRGGRAAAAGDRRRAARRVRRRAGAPAGDRGRDRRVARPSVVHPLPGPARRRPAAVARRATFEGASYLSSIGTAGWARGRGFGRLVTRLAAADGLAAGSEWTYLGVFADNAVAIRRLRASRVRAGRRAVPGPAARLMAGRPLEQLGGGAGAGGRRRRGAAGMPGSSRSAGPRSTSTARNAS